MKLVSSSVGLFASPLLHVLNDAGEVVCGLARIQPDKDGLIRGDKEYDASGEDSIRNICERVPFELRYWKVETL